MHTWSNFECHLFDQDVTVWRDDWNILELKVVPDNDLAVSTHINEFEFLNFSNTICTFGHLRSSELIMVQIV